MSANPVARWRRKVPALPAAVTDNPDRRATRIPRSLQKRLADLKLQRTPIAQLAIGTSVAWFIANQLVGHLQPFFAPIAAVLTIYASVGQRRRTLLQLVLGVSIGILVGQFLILWIGHGAWQIAVIVALAATTASLLGLQGFARTQTTTSAILISAVVPIAGSGNPAINRFTDALIGGAVGLVVTAVIPGNPVRAVDRVVQDILADLANVLDEVALSMRLQDPGPAWTALQSARAIQPALDDLDSTVSIADELSRISPIRWRQRGHVRLYASTVRDIDNAVRDARVLARRVETMIRQHEVPPDDMEQAVASLATAVRIFSDDLAEQDQFDEAQQQLVAAARAATLALPKAATLNSSATVAQVRSLAADLLFASGSTPAEVEELLHFE